MDDGVEPLVLDLVHVDDRVPGGEQRRGADPVADLGRQRVHLVAEDRLLVARRREVELDPPRRPSSALSASSSAWRSTWKGSSPGQSFWTTSTPGSWPQDWMASSRPPGARLRASGASIFSALNSARRARAPRLRGEDEVVLARGRRPASGSPSRAGTRGPRGRARAPTDARASGCRSSGSASSASRA